MLHNKNIPTGTHCWAIIQDKLLIVLKVDDHYYEVCGAWEGGIHDSEFNLISVIDKPQDYKDNELYYFGEVD